MSSEEGTAPATALPTPTPADAGAVFAMMTAHWKSQSMWVVTNANIPDLLFKNGPQTAEQLATATGFQAPFLYRMMRALAADDTLLFAEDADQRFSLTARSMMLLDQVCLDTSQTLSDSLSLSQTLSFSDSLSLRLSLSQTLSLSLRLSLSLHTPSLP
jgi:hypothetical protein